MFTEIFYVVASEYRDGFKSANVKCTSIWKKAPSSFSKRLILVCAMNSDAKIITLPLVMLSCVFDFYINFSNVPVSPRLFGEFDIFNHPPF